MAKKKSSLRRDAVPSVTRSAKGGRFVERAVSLRNATVHVRIPSRSSESLPGQSLRGEALPARKPATGSFTTRKSTDAINANVVAFSEALKRLAKK